MLIPRALTTLICLGLLQLQATTGTDATQVYTAIGQPTAVNTYASTDYGHFMTGSRLDQPEHASTLSSPAKGFAFFDLDRHDLREQLTRPDGNRVLLSFVLLKTLGSPNPLRVEYLGTVADKDDAAARARLFRTVPVQTLESGIAPTTPPGLQVVDVTALLEEPLSERWLVFRFVPDGPATGNHRNDLYVFNANTSTVRLTLSMDGDAVQAVLASYTNAGLASALPDLDGIDGPDMPTSALPVMRPPLVPVHTIRLNGSGTEAATGPILSPDNGLGSGTRLMPGVHTQQVGTGNFEASQNNEPGSAGTFTGTGAFGQDTDELPGTSGTFTGDAALEPSSDVAPGTHTQEMGE